MAGFDPRLNNRGNWACPYCNHKSWKGKVAAASHIKHLHPKEAEVSEKIADAEKVAREANTARYQAEATASRLARELAEATKKKAETKYQNERIDIFCPHCHTVQQKVQLPIGQNINNTPHTGCNLTGLMIVSKIT